MPVEVAHSCTIQNNKYELSTSDHFVPCVSSWGNDGVRWESSGSNLAMIREDVRAENLTLTSPLSSAQQN